MKGRSTPHCGLSLAFNMIVLALFPRLLDALSSGGCETPVNLLFNGDYYADGYPH